MMPRPAWLLCAACCLAAASVLALLGSAVDPTDPTDRTDLAAAQPPVPSPKPLPLLVADPVGNYPVGPRRHRSGSCLHAAVQDLLRWQGLDAQADYWRAHFGGAANVPEVAAIADALGLRHAETES